MALTHREVMALLGRYSKAEAEFNTPWLPLTTLRSPTSLRTDRFISFLLLKWHGRITITVAPYAALSVDSLRNLLGEIRVLGSHAQFGAQTPVRIPAFFQSELTRIYGVTYAPRDNVLIAGVPTPWDGTVNVWDIDAFWIVPLFPLPTTLQLAALYSIKGPDWAGNLFFEADAQDATALGTLGAGQVTVFSAYGAVGGNPTLYVDVIRPLLTSDLMNAISPAISFQSYRNLDAVVQGVGLVLGKLSDLNIGKRMHSFHVQSGDLQPGVSPGVRAYLDMNDGIVLRVVAALDGKSLAVPSSGIQQQNFDGFLRGAPVPVGYHLYNFCEESGNPDSAFAAETLTAARRFEADADVVAAAGQGCLLSQHEILGSPQILGA